MDIKPLGGDISDYFGIIGMGRKISVENDSIADNTCATANKAKLMPKKSDMPFFDEQGVDTVFIKNFIYSHIACDKTIANGQKIASCKALVGMD